MLRHIPPPMVSIKEELEAAKVAKAMVGALLTRPISAISAEPNDQGENLLRASTC
jgi:hypothetical protein